MNKKWLIWSIEHNGWWMPNHNGYTRRVDYAGRYSFEEAKKIAEGANYGLTRSQEDQKQRNTPNEAICPAPEDFENEHS